MIKKTFFTLFVILLLGAFAAVGYANHSWGPYHWARTVNPFSLKLGDNVSATWDGHLAVASSNWTLSSVLNTGVVAGANKKNCGYVNGQVEVCNKTYGNNGWLGIAQIWVSGNHITKGVTKMNDTYFDRAPYNTAAWRQFVICQEIGHTFGLDHQDENFNNVNLGTCMDYTNDPDGGPGGVSATDPSNEHPNAHDFVQLEIIYAHLDALFNKRSSASASAGDDIDTIDTSDAKEWGKEIRKSKDGQSSLHERDLGNGNKVFTFVIWAQGE